MAKETTSGKDDTREPEIEVIEEDLPEGTKTEEEAPKPVAGDDYDRDEDEGRDERPAVTPGQGEGGQVSPELTARQRRRQRERDARNAERVELARLRSENEQLRSHAAQTDRRISNVETSAIDNQIASVEQEIHKANTVMSRAMAAQNGEDFVEAQNIRDVLRDRLNELRRIKGAQEERDKRPAQGQQQGQQPGQWRPTKEQVHNARMFLQRHPWYRINGTDEDSQTVTSIDNEMMAQGGNPSTAEYWMELERRINEEMPHRAPKQEATRAATNGNGQAGGPRLPGGGGGGGSDTVQKFHLSAARKQALIDLGVYDDPEKRMKHIKRFIEWDKANAGKK